MCTPPTLQCWSAYTLLVGIHTDTCSRQQNLRQPKKTQSTTLCSLIWQAGVVCGGHSTPLKSRRTQTVISRYDPQIAEEAHTAAAGNAPCRNQAQAMSQTALPSNKLPHADTLATPGRRILVPLIRHPTASFHSLDCRQRPKVARAHSQTCMATNPGRPPAPCPFLSFKQRTSARCSAPASPLAPPCHARAVKPPLILVLPTRSNVPMPHANQQAQLGNQSCDALRNRHKT